jgi:hypothetical protein
MWFRSSWSVSHLAAWPISSGTGGRQQGIERRPAHVTAIAAITAITAITATRRKVAGLISTFDFKAGILRQS